ncbi:MAG: FAD-dependent oxidoreductase [Methylophilaceae bacterium]|nr:FAD-dependent oxidoreductase [Methylophilaceae bacterium]
MKIAIIGGGIAGNTLAYHLNKEHNITLFEAENHIGGHTHTHSVEMAGSTYKVDTGFIVFNDRTYPNFNALLDTLEVPWQNSEMSFSVKCENTGLEYNGTTLNSMFAQRSNFLRPKFYGMIRDIMRFNKNSLELLADGVEVTLGDYLAKNNYGDDFMKFYIIPMGAAIWSTDATQMLDFPARFFVRFFHHHGMLTVNNRPQWRTIVSGSAQYVAKLTESFKDKIKLNTPIESVRRLKKSVIVKPLFCEEQIFDWVFFACHSDQALNMLRDASAKEKSLLSAIPYQENTVFLHTDTSLMPKRKLAWAAWNYHLTPHVQHQVAVTYNMNILQNIPAQETLLVTLNHTRFINPAKVIKRLKYMHPIFTLEGAAAQQRHAEISGVNRTCYAGAYWRNGFHEDGVASALTALEHFKSVQNNSEECLNESYVE